MPRRLKHLTASIATLPPPITYAFLAFLIGVVLSSLYEDIKLILVNTSLAENTSFAFSPGIPINFGRPAPEHTNTSSYSWLKSSRVIAFPTGTSVLIVTPNLIKLSTSLWTILLGSLNSGIPYVKTPPALCKTS